ncbi:DUF6492 family protein [Devosia sp. BK]|uniref:DUF6492 family protein n=1 Tax=Devosia sp. BK TaxID=2871706 RepID=UPI00293A8AF5|nr:DUF6492 family protein [Devosia sp. BK]MDV3252193.1 DUF6492 family protein [Devosia sp. BK]
MTASISLITPSYSGDFASCQLLCASIDRHVTGFDRHYLVVGDEDASLFAPLAGPRRQVVPHSALLPRFVSVGRWRGRRYWWRPEIGLPVYGWHLQQLRKLAMTLHQSQPRVMCIDSDNCFVRPVDFSALAHAEKTPLFWAPNDIDETRPAHLSWLQTAHAVLGLSQPTLPGPDYIGQMITWERESVATILARIEATTGAKWWASLCRRRQFSEYLLYGVATAHDPALAARHALTKKSLCRTHWDSTPLTREDLGAFIAGMTEDQVAIAIQSHSGTPIELIRAAALA